jgi:catechol 2,3-dioxygenase-like lactoylglutathione lyase family enzyme
LLNHIAIATSNLETMAEFYAKLPISTNTEWKLKNHREKYAFWLYLKDSTILMIEKREYCKSCEAILFAISSDLQYDEYLELAFEKTKYSFYFRDPDGNKIGFSSYPIELKEVIHE